jgi:hypothetical protein
MANITDLLQTPPRGLAPTLTTQLTARGWNLYDPSNALGFTGFELRPYYFSGPSSRAGIRLVDQGSTYLGAEYARMKSWDVFVSFMFPIDLNDPGQIQLDSIVTAAQLSDDMDVIIGQWSVHCAETANVAQQIDGGLFQEQIKGIASGNENAWWQVVWKKFSIQYTIEV